MIKFVFDIDGVLTDGKVWIDEEGNFSKCLNMKDIDAVNELKRQGCKIYAVTAERNAFTKWVFDKFNWDGFYEGVQDKGTTVSSIKERNSDYIVYVGDGKKDLAAFEVADYTVCPVDAIGDIKTKADYILMDKAGTGVLWELLALRQRIENESHFNGEDIWLNNVQSHFNVLKLLMQDQACCEEFQKAADILCETFSHGRRAYIFGNGGSASDAQHIAAEFVGKYKSPDVFFDMAALNVNSSVLTAIGNDFNFGDVFFRQISCMLKPGDVAIGISTSGRSGNVIKALDKAKELGGHTILLTGDIDERYSYDVTFKVPSKETPRIQEMHILIGHSLADYVEEAYLNAHRKSN